MKKFSKNCFFFVFLASLQKFLNTRSRRKVEQFSSALLVEASVLAELSDDLLSQSDANSKAAKMKQVYFPIVCSRVYMCVCNFVNYDYRKLLRY